MNQPLEALEQGPKSSLVYHNSVGNILLAGSNSIFCSSNSVELDLVEYQATISAVFQMSENPVT